MKIVEPGIASVQDAGRPLARRHGFPPAGPLDLDAWVLANEVMGNVAGAAAIELLAGTFVAELRGRVVVATFDGEVTVDGVPAAPWCVSEVGRELRVVAGTTSYIAVAGGIDVPLVLGSRSAISDRLHAGDVLPVGAAEGRGRVLARPPVPTTGPLRVVAGPQADGSDLDALVRTTWLVGPAVDRMGVRLEGQSMRPSVGRMLSDGVVPGSIQVPPDGQPIILLADGPTTGGYPKVAVVATVDLGRAGRLRPGDEVAFEPVTVEEAHALRASAPDLAASSRPLPASGELLEANLVSGAVDVTGQEEG